MYLLHERLQKGLLIGVQGIYRHQGAGAVINKGAKNNICTILVAFQCWEKIIKSLMAIITLLLVCIGKVPERKFGVRHFGGTCLT